MYPTYLTLQRAIAVIVLGGSLAVIIIGTDRYFPFSNYPMYSAVFTPSPNFDIYSTRGLFSDGSEQRLRVSRYLYPFNPASFRESLFSDLDADSINRKLKATLRWHNHESAATEGADRLPFLSVRAYRSTVPWLDFVEMQKAKRDLRDLVKGNTSVIGEAHEEP